MRCLEAAVGCQNLPVGVAHPAAISPSTGLLKNSNSTCLNSRPFKQDPEAVLGHEVYLANDADCLAVSEARDGAAAGAANVFAVILGTGVGGVANGGRRLRGPNAIAGEWGSQPAALVGGGVSRVERLYRTVPTLWDLGSRIASTPSSRRHCTATPAACGAPRFCVPKSSADTTVEY